MAAIQAIDATTLRALLAELRSSLLPSRFEKAQQSDPHTLQLALRGLEGCRWIELGWQAEAPRLHGISAPPRRGEGSTLAQQLQHGLRGLALVSIEQQGWERVVELGFARRPGEPDQRWLVLELMGRRSNLFLLDERRRVVAAGRQVRPEQSRFRPIGTGDPYSPPPPLAGEPPRSEESLDDWRRRLSLVPLPLQRALQDAYQGISPGLARQLVDGLEVGQGPPLLERLVTDLQPADWQALHRRWRAWLLAVEQKRFQFREGGGCDYRCWDGDGTENNMGGGTPPPPGAMTPVAGKRAARDPGPDSLAAGPINRALAHYYGTRLASRELEQRRAALRQRLVTAASRESREADQQRSLLEAAAGSEALQLQADALLCQGDPPKEVIAQAQKLYHQARRLRRSVAAIEPRLALHRQRLDWLETSLHFLDQSAFLEQSEASGALRDLEQEIEEQLVPRQGQRRRRREAPTPQPLELRSPGGLRLQVGRNHRQNEWISLRQARRGDLWFHVQECPGSHVVLKGSEASPREEDLAAAADLAAHFSRARGNSRVPVVLVAAETLQRIAGAGAGTVRHGSGEILWGEPERGLRLLAQGREDGAEPGRDGRPGAAIETVESTTLNQQR
jgi:predicted ribosome quality control (RQC) complex YloA/Tae2 family protein